MIKNFDTDKGRLNPNPDKPEKLFSHRGLREHRGNENYDSFLNYFQAFL
jgi:hypothetical protein